MTPRQTYTPRRMDEATAAAAASTGDLVPWTEVATLTSTRRGTVRAWMDLGKVATITVHGVRHVSLAEVADVEHELRTTRRAGRPRG